ncbi:coiled-coil domain-containing protein 134-like [Bombus pyrosoma]|uniref:coiled-coil domain-containing protein 134-like n=1 Tax=Bombus pyrosoma TaxID=396416 RepID=UPI001CB8BD66|nr:coiled-coil domain-containing protein 134-like [Bombus pyrosoma]
MILVIGEKMIDTIEVNKALIANEDFNPDDRFLPQNVTIQTAISTVLENTAFFGDILLHFPHFIHRILKAQQKWNPIINWSLNFTYRTKYLLDSETVVKIHLASQELNVIKREQGYFNPYWQPTDAQEGDNGKIKKKKSATKGKQKKGPQLTKKDGWLSSSKISEEYLKIVMNPGFLQTLLETAISFSANKSEDFSDDGDGAVVESGQPMS